MSRNEAPPYVRQVDVKPGTTVELTHEGAGSTRLVITTASGDVFGVLLTEGVVVEFTPSGSSNVSLIGGDDPNPTSLSVKH